MAPRIGFVEILDPPTKVPTLFAFQVTLSDLDRQVYETLHLRAALHPTETAELLVLRLLAYVLEYDHGIGWTAGLEDIEQPMIWVRDLSGTLQRWIDVGAVDLERLRQATRQAPMVILYTAEDLELLRAALLEKNPPRRERIHLRGLSPILLESIAGELERRTELSITVVADELFVTVGGLSFSSVVEQRELVGP